MYLLKLTIACAYVLIWNHAGSQVTPGGITTQPSFWIKANLTTYIDNGSTLTTDGQSVQQWNDQSPGANHVSQSILTKKPIYRFNTTNNINFNPFVDFESPKFLTRPDIFGGTISEFTGFVVSYAIGYQGNSPFTLSFLDVSSNQRMMAHFPHLNGNVYWDCENVSDNRISTPISNPFNRSHIGLFSNSVIDNLHEIGLNGRQLVNAGSAIVKNELNQLTIGAGLKGTPPFNAASETLHFQGKIMEEIFFNKSITGTDRRKVDSYLAMKYGITLDNSLGGTAGDYLSSSTSTIWDASINSSYHNNIIAIARDNASGLLQKQSITDDNVTTIYLNALHPFSSSANSGNISNDLSFLLIGNNNGLVCNTLASMAEVPPGIQTRLEREWKVTKTDFNETFSIDILLNSMCANITNLDVNDLRLLVDTDGDFTNASIYDDGGGLSIAYSSGKISVSGISFSQLPNNSINYLTIGSINLNATPLPSELIEFTANLNQNVTVDLSWKTATEINSDYFLIEKISEQLSQWEPIEKIASAGYSNEIKSYHTIDRSPYGGTNYYRLKIIDVNGSYKYSNIEAVNLKLNKPEIYPNPTSEIINLLFNKKLENNQSFLIYSTNMELVYTDILKEGNSRFSINLSFLAKGVYYIKIENDFFKVLII